SSGVRFMDLDFPMNESREYFDRVINIAREMAELIGAEFRQDPVTEFLKRLITVHPLGGCPMGDDAATGVVDSFGQVFNYPGFFIADGSVMPGPVGPNPSLTIAALSHRFAGAVLGDK